MRKAFNDKTKQPDLDIPHAKVVLAGKNAAIAYYTGKTKNFDNPYYGVNDVGFYLWETGWNAGLQLHLDKKL